MPQNGVLCGNTAGRQCLGTTAQENGGDDPMDGGASLTTLSSALDGDQPHVFANCMAASVAGSTAALLRGEQAAAMELPMMQLDATRPWASRGRPPLYCAASRRGDGAVGDAARHVAAVGATDRPLLCREASRRRRWSCR
jgi:hypothetical protein